MTLLAIGGAAVVLVAAVIGVGALTRGGGSAPPVDHAALAEGRAKGRADAPVVMVEFADMQCPNCAFFAQGTERRLTEKYIATGKVRLESKHFAFLGQESVRAAQAVECANEQGRFWEYRDAVYAAQKGENRGTFSDTKLKQIAAEVGANSEALGACLSSGRTADQVNRDLQEGKKMGVSGTPTFFINGRMIVGAQPDAAFESAIEQALAARGAR